MKTNLCIISNNVFPRVVIASDCKDLASFLAFVLQCKQRVIGWKFPESLANQGDLIWILNLSEI
jgi:hypothetical protein